jgi:hypothetical protein
LVRRIHQAGVKLQRLLTHEEAYEAARKGRDIATDSGKAQYDMAREVSKACGGGGRVVSDRPHNPGELPHMHPGKNDPRDARAHYPSHIYNEPSLFDEILDLFAPLLVPGVIDHYLPSHGEI